MEALTNSTIVRARERLRNGDISAGKITEELLGVIHKTDKSLHAYLELFEDDALAQANAADSASRTAEHVGALSGVPLAVKDNILVKGRRASAASRMLENHTAAYDATAIQRLRSTGAVFLGRTNMDEFAMGSSTENSAYGPTKNPHNEGYVPGGSSGGSASAVASGECLAALGSDTGGSIRQPAAFCGVVGLKPTYGAVSRHGLIAMASSLDVIGPIAKTVEDAKIIFDVIKGKDSLDSTTTESQTTNQKSQKRKKIILGIPREYFGPGLHPEVKASVLNAISKLRAQSAGETSLEFIIRDISLPHSDYALATYYIIMPAEVSTNLARYDGIRYGLSKKADDLLGVYMKSRHAGFGEEVRRRIILGTYVLSVGYYDAYYAKAQNVRALIRRDFERAFADVDVIVSPTTPSPAFKLGEKSDDPVEMYLSDVYTVSANLTGIPALTVPCGATSGGLPIGIQFMGRWHEEDTLFQVGNEWERLRDIAA